MNPTETPDIRELDHRSGDGIDVTLLWRAATNQVYVAVRDDRHGASIEIEVDPAHAHDAFLHPFVYAHAGEYALAA